MVPATLRGLLLAHNTAALLNLVLIFAIPRPSPEMGKIGRQRRVPSRFNQFPHGDLEQLLAVCLHLINETITFPWKATCEDSRGVLLAFTLCENSFNSPW